MRYFFDTEFNDTGTEMQLISLGIVSDTGQEWYAQDPAFDWSEADPAKYWLRENVLPGLHQCGNGESRESHITQACYGYCPWKTKQQMKESLYNFIRPANTPIEFWGFFVSWDWINLCRIFGRLLFDIPPWWPQRANDIAQLADMYGYKLNRNTGYTHNALDDARWTKRAFYDMVKELRI